MLGADTVCDGTETSVEPSPAVLIEYDQRRNAWRSAYLLDDVVMGDAEPLFGRWCDDHFRDVTKKVV